MSLFMLPYLYSLHILFLYYCLILVSFISYSVNQFLFISCFHIVFILFFFNIYVISFSFYTGWRLGRPSGDDMSEMIKVVESLSLDFQVCLCFDIAIVLLMLMWISVITLWQCYRRHYNVITIVAIVVI